MLKGISLSFIALMLVGCGRSSSSRTHSNVRFEEVRADGSFVASEFLLDESQKYEEVLPSGLEELSVFNFKDNRIKILFVGDGYNQNQQTQFLNDVELQKQRILSQQPFKAYEKYFSFTSMGFISQDSGVSRTENLEKKTALDMHYGCAGIDRLLCVNTLKLESAVSSKNLKPHMIFALANDPQYGGAGYMTPAVATLSAKHPMATELAIHEFGHSFAKLADEYDDSGVPSECQSFQNVSAEDEGFLEKYKKKWFRWLDLPHVGAFAGSCYSKAFFRPTQKSKMRNLGQSFEEVNTEQIILKMYEKLKLIESSTPTARSLRNHSKISIETLQPSETPLEIQWKLNNIEIPQLRGSREFDTKQYIQKSGDFLIEVLVRDPTLRVRNIELKDKLMTEKRVWALNVRGK